MEKILQQHAAHLQRIHFTLLIALLIFLLSLLGPSNDKLARALDEASLLQEAKNLITQDFIISALGGNPYSKRLPIELNIEDPEKPFFKVQWPNKIIGIEDKGSSFLEDRFKEISDWAGFKTIEEAAAFFDRLHTLRQYHIKKEIPVRIVSRENQPVELSSLDEKATYDESIGPYLYAFYPYPIREFTYPHALIRLKLKKPIRMPPDLNSPFYDPDDPPSFDYDFFGILNLDDMVRSDEIGFSLLNRFLVERGARPLPVGDFEQMFPDLYSETIEINSMTVEQTVSHLRRQIDEKRTVNLLGLEISISDLARIGLPILILLQFYFIVHLREFTILAKDSSEIIKYPWIVLFPSLAAKSMAVGSTFLLPLAFSIVFIISYDESSLYEFSFIILALLVSVVVGFLTMLQLRKYWNQEKHARRGDSL